MSTVAAQDAEQLYPAGPIARLRPLFAPRGIAVIGASRDLPAAVQAAETVTGEGLLALDAVVTFRDHAALEEADHHA